MKRLIVSLLAFGLSLNLYSQDCKLVDGKYRVVYDEEFQNYPDFEFFVDGDTIRSLTDDRIFLLEQKHPNSFRFEQLNKSNDSLTDFQKSLICTWKPYYEISDCKKDMLSFINRVNLHIISHSGKLVRVED